MNFTSKTRLRLRSAMWAAGVAGILFAACVFLPWPWTAPWPGTRLDPMTLELFLATAMAAGISGYAIGWRLLDPKALHDAWAGLGWGLLVALLAYPILGLLLGLIVVAVDLFHFLQGDHDWQVTSIRTVVLWAVLLVPFGGVVYTGWITLPVAGTVGYLFGRRYRNR
jgi:hypothetical protein